MASSRPVVNDGALVGERRTTNGWSRDLVVRQHIAIQAPHRRKLPSSLQARCPLSQYEYTNFIGCSQHVRFDLSHDFVHELTSNFRSLQQTGCPTLQQSLQTSTRSQSYQVTFAPECECRSPVGWEHETDE